MGIQKNINSLKLELFLIFRLFQEGYGPKYWWPYAKNKFLGNYLFRYLPRYEYIADPDLELHIVCSSKHLWMLAWMLHSFFAQSGLKPNIVIHEDGTMDKATAKLIQSKFANVMVMFRDETTKRILAMPDIPEIIKKARVSSHFFLDRLSNLAIFSKAKRILLSDVDILYFKPPIEVIDFMTGKTDLDALGQQSLESSEPYDLKMDDYYVKKYKLDEKRLYLMNGGYLMLDRQKLNVSQIVEYLEHVQMPFTDYFIEMSGWACVLAQLNFKYLSPHKYAIKGRLNDTMIMKHFTSPRRYEMFAYGIDKARENIDKI
ncbi:MAG TPA: hypothetical protein VI978_01565 [Candidatus Paceibacterota bacterium]